MIIALLVAPFWVGAYIAAGWYGVAFMAIVALMLELQLRNAQAQQQWQDSAIARERWGRWNG